jgi:hypothetical protein
MFMHRKKRWLPLTTGKRLALGAGALLLAALSGLPFVFANRVVLPGAEPVAIDVRSSPFVFNRFDPEQTVFGSLEWRGGLILSAQHSAFGGWSGLSLSADGSKLLAVSDRGAWISGSLNHESQKLSGVSDVRIGTLKGEHGAPISGVWENDAEALVALDPDGAGQGGGLNGRYLIGYEGYGKRIEEVAYRDGALSPPRNFLQIPPELRKIEDNKGIEGIAILRGGERSGAMVIFAERKLDAQGDHTGALVIQGKSHPLFLKRRDAFDVTALESLPDGSLLVLERSFIKRSLKLGIRLRLIEADAVKPGARLDGEVLLDADTRYAIDNFEAMAVSRNEADETLITLMSDDNFNFFQSTMLAQFALSLENPRTD